MKIKKVLPKVKEEVIIPEDLLNFLKINIYQAYLNHQLEAISASDDGIQNQIACAGLVDPDLKKFIVTYYPQSEVKSDWSFNITLDELKEVADGKKNTLTLWKCNVDGCQNKSDREDSVCLLHDFVDDGTGEPEWIRDIHKLSFKEMLAKAYESKKNKTN